MSVEVMSCIHCDAPVNKGEFAYGDMSVCSACAERVANLYWKSHSGVYLTWEEDTPSRPTYRKKPIPEDIRWAVFERDEFRCLCCGSRTMLRADHVEPEVNGGNAVIENLQTLCSKCNSTKGTKNTDYRGRSDE